MLSKKEYDKGKIAYKPSRVIKVLIIYSKTCLKQTLKRILKFAFQDRISLIAGQKYCSLPECSKHSAILSTYIKLPPVFKTFVLYFYELSLNTARFYCAGLPISLRARRYFLHIALNIQIKEEDKDWESIQSSTGHHGKATKTRENTTHTRAKMPAPPIDDHKATRNREDVTKTYTKHK